MSKTGVQNQIGNNVVRKKSGTGDIHNKEQSFEKLIFRKPVFACLSLH